MSFYRSFIALVVALVLHSVTFAQKRIACIGDSVTKGYGIKDSTQSYPSVLQTLLGNEFVVGNFGHSGATLLNKGHNPYTKTKVYADALAFKPDVIVIALGLNDTDPRNWPNYNNEFLGDYSRLIADFRAINPNVEVYVCNLTPIFSGHKRFLSGTRDWFQQIQDLIPAIVDANQTKFIDNHKVLASRIDLMDDYLHPDSQGASIIASNVYRHLIPVKQALSVDETFGDHMVLQRDRVNILKGKASANVKVEVEFQNQKIKTVSSDLGIWEISLPKQKAGGPYTIEVKTDKEKIVLNDVLFGDVFLASGQSNMAWPLRSVIGGKELVEQASNNKLVRVFKNKNLAETSNVEWDSLTLQKVNDLAYFSGNWELSSPQSVSDFSAIAYVAALEVSKSQNIPIGIIDISVGGSNTESWISRSVLEDDNLLASYIHTWKTSDFVQDFCRERGAKNINLSKKKNQRHPYEPAYNYESGIAKWLDTQLQGVLWYQGESNAHNIEHHEYLFKKMVTNWRADFKQDLPFYIVQLSSINRPSWGEFRDSQRGLSNEIDNVYLAVSSDLGDMTDVHPRNKIPVGNRIANLIKQHEYKSTVQADSPQPVSWNIKNGIVTVIFNNCKSLKTNDNSVIKDLKIVTPKGEILDIMEVKINKNALQFSTDKQIKEIQYGYTAFTNGNLLSDSDVPVSTFKIAID